MNAVVEIKKGLEGVVVDSTSISLVDGEAGRLVLPRPSHREAGQEARLRPSRTWCVFGELPDAARLEEFEEFLWEAGRLPAELVRTIEQLARMGGHPMATLQAAMPLMAAGAAGPQRSDAPTMNRKRWSVAARLPTAHALLAGVARRPDSDAVSADSPLWRALPAAAA